MQKLFHHIYPFDYESRKLHWKGAIRNAVILFVRPLIKLESFSVSRICSCQQNIFENLCRLNTLSAYLGKGIFRCSVILIIYASATSSRICNYPLKYTCKISFKYCLVDVDYFGIGCNAMCYSTESKNVDYFHTLVQDKRDCIDFS